EALQEHVVAPGTLSVHADRYAVVDENLRERITRELAALIRVEDLRPAIAPQSLINHLNAKIHFEVDRQARRQDPTRKPVHDRREVDEAPRHRDVRDV